MFCAAEISHGAKTCLTHQPTGGRTGKFTRMAMSDEHKAKISDALFGKTPANNLVEGKFANVKRGWFDIGDKKMFFRSTWEANYALYLNFLVKQKEIKSWTYESKMFIFEKIQFGTRTYRPDFEVITNRDLVEYHEVKGWMTPKSKTQLKRMAKYYPWIKVIVIDRKSYSDIAKKLGKVIGFY
jgi:hypothetical protein